MSKSRKILGALLAVVMVLSILSISAFAAENTSYEEVPSAYSQRWSLGQPVSQGGTTYKIEVNLTTTYPVGPVAFRLVGANVISVTGGTEYYSNPLTTQGDTGMVLIVPDTSATVPAHSVNGHIATVTYTTSNANGAVTLEKSAKTADSPNGTLVASRCTAGTVNASDFVVGQYTYVNGELLNEGTTPPPAETPVLTGVNGAVVDDSKGYVYGIPASTKDITTYFSVSGTGVIEVTANASGATNGTGATIKLYNSSKSEVIKTYTLIIFGDVTGDGAINLLDAGAIQKSANFVGDPLVGCCIFAADVNCDGAINLLDAGAVQKAANFVGDPIPANPWA